MHRAATALAGAWCAELRARRGSVAGASVVALVGRGNNGGDALHALAALAGARGRRDGRGPRPDARGRPGRADRRRRPGARGRPTAHRGSRCGWATRWPRRSRRTCCSTGCWGSARAAGCASPRRGLVELLGRPAGRGRARRADRGRRRRAQRDRRGRRRGARPGARRGPHRDVRGAQARPAAAAGRAPGRRRHGGGPRAARRARGRRAWCPPCGGSRRPTWPRCGPCRGPRTTSTGAGCSGCSRARWPTPAPRCCAWRARRAPAPGWCGTWGRTPSRRACSPPTRRWWSATAGSRPG